MVQLPQEVVQLLELAVSHPDGEEAVFEGCLESVAALYGVHPGKVERLRECLEHPVGRAHAEQIVAHARTRRLVAQPMAQSLRAPADVAALIARAGELPNGLEVLTRAPIDTAAVLLQAHPFAVDAARSQLAANPNGGNA